MSGAGNLLGAVRAVCLSHIFGVLPLSSWSKLAPARFVRQVQMSRRIHKITRAAALAALLAAGSLGSALPVRAQSDDVDPEARILQLENQLRQLTGQNEELAHRNRILEEQLRALQGGAQATAPGQPGVAPPQIAAMPPVQIAPNYRQPAASESQIAAPPPIVQEPAPRPGRRGDAFDPAQN